MYNFIVITALMFISNTLEEFLDKFEKTPAGLQMYLSAGVLLAAAEKQPTLIDKRELSSCIVRKQY